MFKIIAVPFSNWAGFMETLTSYRIIIRVKPI